MTSEFSNPDRELKFVFDVAGVLLTWDSGAVFDDVFTDSGRDKHTFFTRVIGDDFQRAVSLGQPAQPLLESLSARYPEWQEEIRLWSSRWDDMLVGAIDGTVSVIGELQERGYGVYILGNWGREEFDRAAQRFGFLNNFDDILLSSDCGYLKPDSKIFEAAESRFGLVPEKTIFIDDRSDNVEAALARNWNGIIFESPRQLYLTLMDYSIL